MANVLKSPMFSKGLLTFGSVSQVDLSADVTGSLPLANIANIAAATVLGNNTAGDSPPIALTAAQVRTLLGLATSDSPEFAAVNIGHAIDTTLARVSAGVLSVEGNTIYAAGGTDVVVADGGTGRSSHTAYAVLCGGTTTTAAQQSIAGVGTSGQVLTSNGAGALPTFQTSGAGTVTSVASADGSVTVTNGTTTPDLALNKNWISGLPIINGYLAASVSASALTISILNMAGAAPSVTTPVMVAVHNPAGGLTVLALTASTTLVISSGSTVGTSNGVPFKLWVVGFNDGGTFRLGVVNCRLTPNDIYRLRENSNVSSTAEGGAGGADAAQTIYTGTAVAGATFRILGYLEFATGQATAGAWATNPSVIVPATAGISLPGEVVQAVRAVDGAHASGTTVMPLDNTIPQNTEGDQYLSKSITPLLASNMLRVSSSVTGATSQYLAVMALFRDSTANAFAAVFSTRDSVLIGATGVMVIDYMDTANSTTTTTYKIRCGPYSAATFYFNGDTTARLGGIINSFIHIDEIMT